MLVHRHKWGAGSQSSEGLCHRTITHHMHTSTPRYTSLLPGPAQLLHLLVSLLHPSTCCTAAGAKAPKSVAMQQHAATTADMKPDSRPCCHTHTHLQAECLCPRRELRAPTAPCRCTFLLHYCCVSPHLVCPDAVQHLLRHLHAGHAVWQRTRQAIKPAQQQQQQHMMTQPWLLCLATFIQ